ncbi:hypothetical protein [Nocardia salmonicida]|uniref:hypothetical protein n=1 Tax=Nocardia salmonicida TaxID=53431 RepID=UPI0036355F3F
MPQPVEAGFVVSFAALTMQAAVTVAWPQRSMATPLDQTAIHSGLVRLEPFTVVAPVYRPDRCAAAVLIVTGIVAILAAAALAYVVCIAIRSSAIAS